MQIGGIASSLANWLNYLEKETEHEVDLVVFDDLFHPKFEYIKSNSNVNLITKFKYLRLGKQDLRRYKNPLLYILYGFIYILRILNSQNVFFRYIFKRFLLKKEYDLAISYSNDQPIRKDNVLSNDFVEFSVKAKKKVAWIHNDLSKLGYTRDFVIKRYKNFDQIVTVSESCKHQLISLSPEYAHKIMVVSNPINLEEINDKKDELIDSFNSKTINFVTVARMLNIQKRIDRILDVASLLKENNYKFYWYLLGGGPDFDILRQKCIDMNLTDCVLFKGFVNNPYPYIKNADYFVLTSDYEAQPVSILESLTLGTAVISTNFPMACSYIDEGQNGFITEMNVNSIYSCLKNIIENNIEINDFDFKYDLYKIEFDNLLKRIF